jgi:hypothetical protein
MKASRGLYHPIGGFLIIVGMQSLKSFEGRWYSITFLTEKILTGVLAFGKYKSLDEEINNE